MKLKPELIGTIHFIGIGGIGMSGIARVLHDLGYKIQGSDLGSSNNQIKQLQQLGVKIFNSHAEENIAEVSLVVVSSAIKQDNIELKAARIKGIAIIHRAEMLGEMLRMRHSIVIAGSHGKTTTTSLAGTLLERAGLDPMIINGGVIKTYGSNIRSGTGDWAVAEADESDGSFKHLQSTIAIVTNIDPEHIDHYGSFANLRQAFVDFITAIPFYGLAILCYDHPTVRQISHEITTRGVITYGLDDGADIQAKNLRYLPDSTWFDLHIKASVLARKAHFHTKQWLPWHHYLDFDLTQGPAENHLVIPDIKLNMVGAHNVQNSLSIIAIAIELGINLETVKTTLSSFTGVERRFTFIGYFGNNIRLVDDYAHHPVEIAATLKTARQYMGETEESLANKKGRLIAIWQPHRYSRVRTLAQDFAESLLQADHIIILPVYGAGEAPEKGINTEYLASLIRDKGHKSVHEAKEYEDLCNCVMRLANENDLVLGLGAGNITRYMKQLSADLPQNYVKKAAS